MSIDSKKVVILMLHLQFGGIEKQTITFANELSKKCNVEIISAYTLKREKPAYKVSDRVKVKYLIDDIPNRNEFKEAVHKRKIFAIFKEGFKAIRILFLKNYLMIKEIKKLNCDYVFSTRIEYANMLTKYAPKGVIKITQEHLNDESAKYIKKIKKSFKNIDYLITIGRGSTENYSKWLKDNKRIKIVEIPNILEVVPDKSATLNGFNLIAVGRLHPVKDFSTLIKVFEFVQRRIPEARLTIVGGGDEFEKLNNLIKEFGLKDKVKITGMVCQEEVENYMLHSDLYVMTSISECFPMVLLESFSVGVPAIAFDVPVGPRAIINDGQNGYLIKNRRIEMMALKIVELLGDKENLKRLGKNAKEDAYKYLPQNIMKKWYGLFRI